MNFEKKKLEVNTFTHFLTIYSVLTHLLVTNPLIWRVHSRAMNNNINRLYEIFFGHTVLVTNPLIWRVHSRAMKNNINRLYDIFFGHTVFALVAWLASTP